MAELEFSTPEIVTFWALCSQEHDTFYDNHYLKIEFTKVGTKSVPVFSFEEESDAMKRHGISVQDFVNDMTMARFPDTSIVMKKIKKAMQEEPEFLEARRRPRITLLDLQRLYFSLSTMKQWDTITGLDVVEIRDRMTHLIYACILNINTHRVVCTDKICDRYRKKSTEKEE